MKIKFGDKRNGVQLGFKLQIETQTNQLLYHIKTHQHGSQSTLCSSNKKCDIKELFVYKMLNKLGLMPEVHFIYYNYNGSFQFCIATLDVKDDYKLNIQNADNFNLIANDELMHKYPRIIEIPDFTYYLTLVDMLVRIFKLSDCLTNFGNFGFIIDETISLKVKLYLFDFQVSVADNYGYHSRPILNQLKNENRELNIFSNFCQNVLKDREESVRINESKCVINNLNKNFFALLEESYNEIFNYFQDSVLLYYKFINFYALSLDEYIAKIDDKDENKKIKYDDFNFYVQSVKNNFGNFLKDLNKF